MKQMILKILVVLFLTGCTLQSSLDQDLSTMNSSEFNGNLTSGFDDGIRSLTWHYNYGNKEWKYFAMLNATCHQIPCECDGCVAYCIECEGKNNQLMEVKQK